MDTGIVVAFAGPATSIPAGWALCDGRSVNRNDPMYAALFAVIGTAHGGDAATNFNLPDYRGLFLRGVDLGAGRDPDAGNRTTMAAGGHAGNQVGSVQGDALGVHAHTTQGWRLEAQGGSGFDGAGFETNSNRNHPWSHTYGTSSVGAAETRPRNASVNYIIKL